MKHLITLIFLSLLFAFSSCNQGETTSSQDAQINERSSSLTKCDGEQAYLRFSINGEPPVELQSTDLKSANVFTENPEDLLLSQIDFDWNTADGNSGNLLIVGNGVLFKKDDQYIFSEAENQIGILFSSNVLGSQYKGMNGRFELDEFSYSTTNRRETEQLDYAKATLSGQFKNVLAHKNDDVISLEINLCVCGKLENF